LLGSGFIFYLIDKYISLEGMAGYSSFTFKKMKLNDGTFLKTSETSNSTMETFITDGGIIATIQLNFGFPL
jgi:hypothetical protein